MIHIQYLISDRLYIFFYEFKGGANSIDDSIQKLRGIVNPINDSV